MQDVVPEAGARVLRDVAEREAVAGGGVDERLGGGGEVVGVEAGDAGVVGGDGLGGGEGGVGGGVRAQGLEAVFADEVEVPEQFGRDRARDISEMDKLVGCKTTSSHRQLLLWARGGAVLSRKPTNRMA